MLHVYILSPEVGEQVRSSNHYQKGSSRPNAPVVKEKMDVVGYTAISSEKNKGKGRSKKKTKKRGEWNASTATSLFPSFLPNPLSSSKEGLFMVS